MSRRVRFLTTVSATLVVAAVAAPIAMASDVSSSESASASLKASGFTPSKLAGKWSGTWKNLTFGTEGSISSKIQPKPGNKMRIVEDLGGTVFGCPDPPPTSVTLPKGAGQNAWSASGFRISRKSPLFGKLKIDYDFRSRSFTGSGSGPICNPNLTFTIDGKLTPSTFKATVHIDLGQQTATSKLVAEKL